MKIGRKRSEIIDKMFRSYILSSILVMVSVPIHEVADGILLNRAVSSDALSMIALLTPVNVFFIAVKSLLVVGLAILSAKAFGARDYHKASQMFTVAVSACTLVILLLTALAFLFFPQFVRLFCEASSPLYPLLYEYAKIILLQFPLLAIISAIDTYMRLAGKARLVSMTIIGSCLANVVLTWVFLYVFHWGIQGAAIATIICTICSKLAYIPYFITRKFPFRLTQIGWREYGLILRQGIRLGSPSALNEVILCVILFVTNSVILATQGTQGMFVWSIILQVLPLTEMISSGFIGVNQHIGGMLLGENDLDGFHLLIRKSFIIQFLAITAVVAFCVLSPETVFSLFGRDTVTGEYVTYFIFGMLMLLPLRACITITMIMNLGGHTRLSLLFNALCLGGLLLTALASTLLGPGFFWCLVLAVQIVLLAALMITTTVIHRKNKNYSWFTLMPVMPDEVSMILTADKDQTEIKPLLDSISKFLMIAELPKDVEFNVRLITEELIFHIINENGANSGNVFEMRLTDKPKEFVIILKTIGTPRDLASLLEGKTLSTTIIKALAPEAKYDYYNGVCVISIGISHELHKLI